jgi:UDP-N-acetyl-D-mannosaminuronate dehydrogenase
MVILLTDHSSFDYEMIATHSAIVLDTRGKFEQKLNVFKA